MKKQHLVSAVTFLAASPAFASSIPQMDQSSYPGQLVWLGISFVLLYIIVAGFVAPRVSGVLNARETAINDAIAKAEELKAAATNTRGNFEAAGAEARSKAASLVAAAQAEAARTAGEAQAKLAAELEAKAATARTGIADALRNAQAGVDDAVISLTTALSEKLLGSAPSAASVKSAVAQVKKA